MAIDNHLYHLALCFEFWQII